MSLSKLRAVATSARRSTALAALSLAMLPTLAATSRAQNPWTVEIKPSATPLATGACTPIRLNVLDASGKDGPRNAMGTRVSIADFDMTVSPSGTLVGRYDGAAAWYACACPATTGSVATITATYPSKLLAEKAKVPGVSFQATTTVPVAPGKSSGIPIGCDTVKTATVQSGSAPPWSVTLASGVKAIAIGSCTPIRLDLRDASGKETPRNPAGQLISIADFDMAASAGSGSTVAGVRDGPSIWSACGAGSAKRAVERISRRERSCDGGRRSGSRGQAPVPKRELLLGNVAASGGEERRRAVARVARASIARSPARRPTPTPPCSSAPRA